VHSSQAALFDRLQRLAACEIVSPVEMKAIKAVTGLLSAFEYIGFLSPK